MFLTVETDCMTDSKTTFPHVFFFFLEWICGFMPPSNILVYQNVLYGLLISYLLNFPYYHCCSHFKTSVLKGGEGFKIQNTLQIRKKGKLTTYM